MRQSGLSCSGDDASAGCTEPELLGLYDFGRDVVMAVNAEWQLEVQSRADGTLVFSETRDHAVFGLIDDEYAGQDKAQNHNYGRAAQDGFSEPLEFFFLGHAVSVL